MFVLGCISYVSVMYLSCQPLCINHIGTGWHIMPALFSDGFFSMKNWSGGLKFLDFSWFFINFQNIKKNWFFILMGWSRRCRHIMPPTPRIQATIQRTRTNRVNRALPKSSKNLRSNYAQNVPLQFSVLTISETLLFRWRIL